MTFSALILIFLDISYRHCQSPQAVIQLVYEETYYFFPHGFFIARWSGLEKARSCYLAAHLMNGRNHRAQFSSMKLHYVSGQWWHCNSAQSVCMSEDQSHPQKYYVMFKGRVCNLSMEFNDFSYMYTYEVLSWLQLVIKPFQFTLEAFSPHYDIRPKEVVLPEFALILLIWKGITRINSNGHLRNSVCSA